MRSAPSARVSTSVLLVAAEVAPAFVAPPVGVVGCALFAVCLADGPADHDARLPSRIVLRYTRARSAMMAT